MDKLIIKGGRKLHGEVTISGAKNAALPIISACVLANDWCELKNIPNVKDINTMLKLLETMGAIVEGHPPALKINTRKLDSHIASYELVKTMRASSMILGPILARFGKASVSLPGGCAIGARPLNLHLKALAEMGANISIEGGYIHAEAKRLKGAQISFDNVTVTGTENIMMAATLASGTTIIENAACEPEVLDLANFLNKMGAKIEGAGTPRITITGVDKLNGASHSIIPDRIEAGTFVIAAGITGSTITINNCPTNFIETPISKLKEAGLVFEERGQSLIVKGPKKIESVDITTAPHPGFATDLQAQFMALMTIATGTSVIKETIFENRFMHVSELNRLGANISVEGSTAIVKGVEKLSGAPLMATDLRASASLVLAALAAEGTSEIQRIYHLDRGYEKLENKLQQLGADIIRS